MQRQNYYVIFETKMFHVRINFLPWTIKLCSNLAFDVGRRHSKADQIVDGLTVLGAIVHENIHGGAAASRRRLVVVRLLVLVFNRKHWDWRRRWHRISATIFCRLPCDHFAQFMVIGNSSGGGGRGGISYSALFGAAELRRRLRRPRLRGGKDGNAVQTYVLLLVLIMSLSSWRRRRRRNFVVGAGPNNDVGGDDKVVRGRGQDKVRGRRRNVYCTGGGGGWWCLKSETNNWREEISFIFSFVATLWATSSLVLSFSFCWSVTL